MNPKLLKNLNSKNFFTALVIGSIIAFLGSIFLFHKLPNLTGFYKHKVITKEEQVKGSKPQIVNGEERRTTKITTQTVPGKTLWDWLELLLVPLLLAVLSYQLQQIDRKRVKQQADNERELTNINLRNEALQVYLDRMAELLLNKDYRTELFPTQKSSTAESDNPVRDVARIQTVTILRRLEGDKELTARVIHFLRDAELLEFLLEKVRIREVNLSDTNLYKVHLREAHLQKTHLNRANLRKAHLEGADLAEAELEGAYLQEAELEGACLGEANLKEAHLEGANLYRADLEGADLEGADLKGADLEGADLREAKGLKPQQVKVAKNWEKAYYNNKFKTSLDRN